MGLIEIGSRATRLLIADVLPPMRVCPFKTRVQLHSIMNLLGGSEAPLRNELAMVGETVRAFLDALRTEAVERTLVFGTEAIRRLAGSEALQSSELNDLLDLILDARTEATASLIAGFMSVCDRKAEAGDIVVIDQGAGSIEIALGAVAPSVIVKRFASLPLGGEPLLESFRESSRSLDSLRSKVVPVVDGLTDFSLPFGQVIVMGTVATKCAWLTKRQYRLEKYDAKKVDGTTISSELLSGIYAQTNLFSKHRNPEAAWQEFQEFVNPGEPSGDAGERVATGIVPLIEILKRIGKREFAVSALGTRHGMAVILSFAPELLPSAY